MKNSTLLAVGAFALCACTVELEQREDLEEFTHSEEEEPAPNDLVAELAGRPEVPSVVQDLARKLLPTEVSTRGHFLHFQSLGTLDGIELFRVSHGLLEESENGIQASAPKAFTVLEFDGEAGAAIACHTGNCTHASLADADSTESSVVWRPIDALVAAPDVANAAQWLVRFYANSNYGGIIDSYSYPINNTGVYWFGVPTLVLAADNTWSSFRNYDNACPLCLANGYDVEIYDLVVYKNANFTGNSFNFGAIDYDADFSNNLWPDGSVINNTISSFTFQVAVLQACPNNICNPGESPALCPQDCHCGDGICEASETSQSCSLDCDCLALGYQGVCAGGGGTCCNSNANCTGIGIGSCNFY